MLSCFKKKLDHKGVGFILNLESDDRYLEDLSTFLKGSLSREQLIKVLKINPDLIEFAI